MQNNQLARWMNGLRADINGRLDRHEAALDAIQERCVGCAREFGEVVATQKSQADGIETNKSALAEHRKEHRERTVTAAVIGGAVVAAINLILTWGPKLLGR